MTQVHLAASGKRNLDRFTYNDTERVELRKSPIRRSAYIPPQSLWRRRFSFEWGNTQKEERERVGEGADRKRAWQEKEKTQWRFRLYNSTHPIQDGHLTPSCRGGERGPGISVTKEDEDTSQIQNKSPQKAKKKTETERKPAAIHARNNNNSR